MRWAWRHWGSMPARQAAAYFFDGERGDGNVVVVGIAEIVGAVHVGAAIGFDDQVHRFRRAVAELGQIVAFEDIERAEQHHSAGRWRRRADDGVVVERADDGRALDDGVLGQIVEREQRAALLQVVDQLVRQLAVVEVVGVGGDALERARQLAAA